MTCQAASLKSPNGRFIGCFTGIERSPMTAKSETRDFLWFLAKLGLFVFVLRSFIISPFNIPSESMQPRLLIGDYLLVAKWPYG